MGEEEQVVVEKEEPTPTEILLGEDAGPEQEDPGQREGRKSRPEDNEPPPDSPRWKQVYAKMKEFERDREDLKAKLSEKDSVMEEIRKHNAALMSRVEEISNKALDSIGKKEESAGPSIEIQALQTTIEQLEERKAEALEALNSKVVISIDREIRKLEKMLDAEQERQTKASKKDTEKPKATVSQDQDLSPDLKEFMTEAKEWFFRDPIMTGAAMEYDRFLSVQPEWKGKPEKERYKKVKTDIEQIFGKIKQKPAPEGGNSRRPASPESGVGLSKPGGALAKTVKLTPQQLQVAEGLGVSPEEYAKQVLFVQAGR